MYMSTRAMAWAEVCASVAASTPTPNGSRAVPMNDCALRLTLSLLAVGLLAGCVNDNPPPTRLLGGSGDMVVTRGTQEEGRQLAAEACREIDPSSEVELIATDPTGDTCRALGPRWPTTASGPPWPSGEPCEVGDVNETQTGGPGVWAPNSFWQCR